MHHHYFYIYIGAAIDCSYAVKNILAVRITILALYHVGGISNRAPAPSDCRQRNQDIRSRPYHYLDLKIIVSIGLFQEVHIINALLSISSESPGMLILLRLPHSRRLTRRWSNYIFGAFGSCPITNSNDGSSTCTMLFLSHNSRKNF